MEKWVKEMFSEVKNYDHPETTFKELPFDKDNLGYFFKITPIADIDKLKFVWSIDYM